MLDDENPLIVIPAKAGIQNHQGRVGGRCALSPRPKNLIVWVKLIVELQSHYISAIKASF